MIDQLKDKYFPVLDKGFVAVIDSMGNDHSIARAARCSYGEGTKKVSGNRGLIRSLMRDMHTSPFEMCELEIHVGLPIFVARQWVRHRTASLNEYSGRYSVMPMLFYEPAEGRHQLQSKGDKQGSDDLCITGSQYGNLCHLRNASRHTATQLYHDALEYDLTRELARIDLPLSTYTYWYWKLDLKNLLHFLRLRLDSHAQWEIQQYARVIAGIVKNWLPITWEAFDDYVLNGVYFSRQEQAILLSIMVQSSSFNLPAQKGNITEHCIELGMSIRETEQFLTKLEFMGCQFFDDIELDLSTARTPEFYEQMIGDAA